VSKIKNGGLDQYGAKPVKQQRFGTASIEGVKCPYMAVDEDVAGAWFILT